MKCRGVGICQSCCLQVPIDIYHDTVVSDPKWFFDVVSLRLCLTGDVLINQLYWS